MPVERVNSRLFKAGGGSPSISDQRFHHQALQLAFRNHAMPLAGLRQDVTPTGMYCLLVH